MNQVRARRLRRALMVGLGACALAATAAGCGDSGSGGGTATSGGGTTAAEQPAKVAFFGLAAENAYTQYMYRAAQEEAKRANVSLDFFDGRFEGATQYKQMQDAITSGRYQGFIVMPNDQSGVVPVVQQAIARGIKVAALQFPIGADPKDAAPQVEGVSTSVIEDVVTGARVTAEGINAMCVDRDPCKVGILWGSRRVTWDGPAKRPTLVETLDPNVKIVAEADGGFLQAPGQSATADMLQANPDIDVIATPSGDQMTLGAERAIASAGKRIGLADRPEGDVAIIGYGASEAGVERVRDGGWYQTYALVPQTMARKALELLSEAIRGRAVESDGLVQTEISPIGDNVTLETLKENPSFRAEWVG